MVVIGVVVLDISDKHEGLCRKFDIANQLV